MTRMGTAGFNSICEASADYCLELARSSFQSRRRQKSAKAPLQGESSKHLAAERAERRQAVVDPILARKRWTRGQLATEAGVGKATVYGYFDGSVPGFRGTTESHCRLPWFACGPVARINQPGNNSFRTFGNGGSLRGEEAPYDGCRAISSRHVVAILNGISVISLMSVPARGTLAELGKVAD